MSRVYSTAFAAVLSNPDWNALGYWIVRRIGTVAATIGMTGGGVGLVKLLRHAPAPRKSSIWAGCLFDTFQDLASNDSRIGERRPDFDDVSIPEPPST